MIRTHSRRPRLVALGAAGALALAGTVAVAAVKSTHVVVELPGPR